jgi:RHS repeat-associated protein
MLSAFTRLRQPSLSLKLFSRYPAVRRRAVELVVAVACLLCLMPSASAQDKQYTENKPDQSLRSDARVDPSTLGLSLGVTLGGTQGRAGTSLPISLRYSSKQWRISYAMSWQSYINYNTWTRTEFSEKSIAGWTSSLEPPRIEYTGQNQLYNAMGEPLGDDLENSEDYACYIRRINVHLSDGSSHELRKDDTPQCFYRSDPNFQYDFTGTFYAVDGSRTRFDADAGVLYLPDGGRYIFGAYQSVQRYQNNWIEGRWGTTYVDRNGNTLTYNMSTKTWTDTLGRTFVNPLPDNPAAGDQSYTVPGVNGQSVTYTLRWRLLADALSVAGDPLRYTSNRRCNSPNQYTTLAPYLFATSYPVHVCADSQLFNPVVLAEVVLPTGQSYQYKYNAWGEIDKVIEPGGGYERFRYATVSPLGDIDSPYDQANRGVVERWISPSGNGSEETAHRWQYSLTTAGGVGTSTSTAPDGTRSERLLYASPHAGSFGFESPLAGRGYDERSYNSANQMLRRMLTAWSTVTPAGSSQPRNPHVTKIVGFLLDTGGNALAGATEMHYDADLNVDWVKKYDYASVAASTAQTGAIGSIPTGALIRTDETTYLISDPSIPSTTRDAYRARNILALPTSLRVKNAAGTIVSQSEIKYDEAGYAPLACGATVGWTDPGAGVVRGNVTTTRSWLDTTNTWVEMHAQYDACGNVRKAWDAKGNLSQVEYASTYHYAYPTHTISAVPDPANDRATNTPLEGWASYDFTTGRVISTTDANNKTTSYQYSDALNRLTRVDRPDGGWTTYWYDHNAAGDYVGSRTSINATQNTEGYQFFDGLGRVSRSFQYDGSQWITTDTQYDTMGRVWRVSNPYLTGGAGTPINPSGNWTTALYDTLGRVVSVTSPDGAQVITAYSGNEVTVTDQAGKRTKSVTDGLGRLTTVFEDPHASGYTGLNYQTNYAYDVLGNLRKAEQGGQFRYFMYDSLGRLVRAKNPEQAVNPNLPALTDPVTNNSAWSMAYGYDNNGNLTSRTDARGVTMTQQYENLNRPTWTTYSDATPTIGRAYDRAPNGRGRFWADYTAGTSGSSSEILSYDALGRATSRRQSFYNGAGWSDFVTSRGYDKIGNITQQTYPSGHTVSYDQFDVAARLKNFNGNLGDGVTRTYATGIAYDEAGRMSREQFGTQTPLYHKHRYNVRGQLWDVRLSTVNDVENWNRGALQTWYTAQSTGNGASGTDNNGNVRLARTYIPDNDAISSFNYLEQRYDYDALNRLKYSEEYLNGQGAATRQDYDYDRWGNRQINAAATSNTLNKKQFAIDTATNRLGVPAGQLGAMSYDAAGNLTEDSYTGAGTRAYDAENRMTSAVIGINSSSVYTYDADGRRVRRSTPNGTVWQVYGIDGELIAEYAANAAPYAPQKEYGYRNGELLVTATGGGSSGNSSASATFIKSDATTQGSWKGVYGADGYNLAGDGASHPAYAQVSVTGHQSHTWAASTTDVRAVQKSASGSTDRIASTWYTPTNYIIDVNLTDGQEHQVALYGLDWDGNNVRAMRVEVLNAATNAVLDGRDMSAYSAGQYVVWRLRGHVKLKVIYTGPAGLNATVSGLFFDPANASSASTNLALGKPTTQSSTEWGGVASRAVDGNTSGNWNDGSVTHTGTEGAPWWQVDLGSVQQLSDIKVWNRTDCCGSALTNFYVFVSDNPFTSSNVAGQPGVSTYNVAGQAGTPSVVAANRTGRYVRVQLGVYERLSLAEVQVFGGGSSSTGGGEVNWVVTDHLGTPRMIVDQTGSLAGIKRHDYLPFGEELYAGTGGRVAAQGYSAGDNLRQQFTGYERDNETKLDYAQARYYASMQGRFTSVDPLQSSGTLLNPQTFNRYAYVQNNPVNFVDPSGLKARSRTEVPGMCSAENSYEACGGDGGFWGGGGGWGDGFAAFTATFGSHPSQVSQTYANYQLQREVDAFFRWLPDNATYAGDLTWTWTDYSKDSTPSYSYSFSMSRGLDAYFNIFSGGFVIGSTLTDLSGRHHEISLAATQAAAQQAIGGGGSGGDWDEGPNFYRGGTDVTPKPNEVRIKNGLVQTTHGISVFSNPAKIPKRFGVYRLVSLPQSLQIIQRGQDPEHYEVTPRTPMPLADYVNELNRIVLAPHSP